MLKRFLGFLALILLLWPLGITLAAGDPNDQEGSKDPPLFNRMSGYFIYSYNELEFDRFEFQTGPNKKLIVEGYHYSLIYKPNEGVKRFSGLQIIRNYINAVKADSSGGQQRYGRGSSEEPPGGTGKAIKNGALYVVYSDGSNSDKATIMKYAP